MHVYSRLNVRLKVLSADKTSWHVHWHIARAIQAESAIVDADIQKEFARQREHLERSVASLKKKLTKDAEIHRSDNVRILQVNRLTCVINL